MTLNTFTAYTKAQASEVNDNFTQINNNLEDISKYFLLYKPIEYSATMLHIDEEIKLRINGTSLDRSTNNGSSWASVKATSSAITSLTCNYANTNYIIAYNAGEGYYSADGGVNWTTFTLNSGIRYMVGTDSALYNCYVTTPTSNATLIVSKSTNNGGTWTIKASTTSTMDYVDTYGIFVLADTVVCGWMWDGDSGGTDVMKTLISSDAGTTFSSGSGTMTATYNTPVVQYLNSDNYHLAIYRESSGTIYYAIADMVEGSITSSSSSDSSSLTIYHAQSDGDGFFYALYLDDGDAFNLSTSVYEDLAGGYVMSTGFNPVVLSTFKSNAGNYLHGTPYSTTYYTKVKFNIV